MKVLEKQSDEMRNTEDNRTERVSDAELQLDLQRAVERATLQLESRVLAIEDSEPGENDFELECLNELSH